ncbi:MAG: aminoglycoside phosphotransferase family protein [Actinomycetota bacterium]|nr:aminoglycoside phosphotransferase family protein [Actinomycetota bacterium]
MPDIEDPLLPAAPFLTGPHGSDVLEPAVVAAGGVLLHATARQVIYRPSRDLTVMFTASISWGGGPPTEETLVAGTVKRGELPGTVPVEAGDLRVHVWRYPFDPFLPGLADAVTTPGIAALLGAKASEVRLQVVSFRACRRAVVRVQQQGSDDLYVKVIPPADVDGLVARHEALRRGGIPVPELTHVVADRGLVVSRALPGHDLRTALANGSTSLPTSTQFAGIVGRFAAIDLPDAEPVLSLLTAAPRHAAMLRVVLPGTSERLRLVLDAIASDQPTTVGRTIHGDLHDAQLRVNEHGEIVGVLDVDGAGPGDPLDDLARLTAHLHALAVLGNGHDIPPGSPAACDYAALTLRTMRAQIDDRAAFDSRFAAALIGLATGPYRAQSDGWQLRTLEVLELAAQVHADEKDLRRDSSGSHAGEVN